MVSDTFYDVLWLRGICSDLCDLWSCGNSLERSVRQNSVLPGFFAPALSLRKVGRLVRCGLPRIEQAIIRLEFPLCCHIPNWSNSGCDLAYLCKTATTCVWGLRSACTHDPRCIIVLFGTPFKLLSQTSPRLVSVSQIFISESLIEGPAAATRRLLSCRASYINFLRSSCLSEATISTSSSLYRLDSWILSGLVSLTVAMLYAVPAIWALCAKPPCLLLHILGLAPHTCAYYFWTWR